MRKYLIPIALLAAATGARAADGVVSNILDGAEPGKVTVAGITVYGTFDIGGVYQSHGARVPDTYYQGAPYLVGAYSNRSYADWQNNAFSQSMLGVKGTQKLSDLLGDGAAKGWSVGFDLQAQINPLSGTLADNCKPAIMNNGLDAFPGKVAQQSVNGDGSRCGQAFSGDAYGYLKNDVLGQLGFGRQGTLIGDVIGSSDPNKGSYAFSLLAFSGTYGGGGVTELGRWNNSLKYTNTIGFVRVGGQYRFEGGGQGGDAWAVSVGVDLPGPFKGLSIDGVYFQEYSGISIASLKAADCTNLGLSIAACQNTNAVAGTVQDDEGWAIAAKYKFDDASGLKGVQIMGGWEHYTLSNPSGTLDNGNTIGGYTLANTTNTTTRINYVKYLTDRNVDVYWIGGKYAITPKLTAAGGWYHVDAGSYLAGAYTAGGAVTKTACNGKSAPAASSNCSGEINFYGLSLDYQLTKRLDLYGGVSWSDADGGLASNFLHTNVYSIASGVRFRF